MDAEPTTADVVEVNAPMLYVALALVVLSFIWNVVQAYDWIREWQASATKPPLKPQLTSRLDHFERQFNDVLLDLRAIREARTVAKLMDLAHDMDRSIRDLRAEVLRAANASMERETAAARHSASINLADMANVDDDDASDTSALLAIIRQMSNETSSSRNNSMRATTTARRNSYRNSTQLLGMQSQGRRTSMLHDIAAAIRRAESEEHRRTSQIAGRKSDHTYDSSAPTIIEEEAPLRALRSNSDTLVSPHYHSVAAGYEKKSYNK